MSLRERRRARRRRLRERCKVLIYTEEGIHGMGQDGCEEMMVVVALYDSPRGLLHA